MRIISKFRDYYDIKDESLVDKTIVYNRESTGIELADVCIRDKNNRWYLHNYSINQYIDIYPIVIGFCGKTYVVYKVDKKSTGLSPTKTEYLYDFNEVLDLLKLENKWNTRHLIDAQEKWNNKDNIDMFFKAGAPIFTIKEDYNHDTFFETNVELNQYKFYKKFPSFLAFQEIQSFISGVLGLGNKPIVEISDKDKIISNGFDTKTSFRNTEPPKRKQKKIN